MTNRFVELSRFKEYETDSPEVYAGFLEHALMQSAENVVPVCCLVIVQNLQDAYGHIWPNLSETVENTLATAARIAHDHDFDYLFVELMEGETHAIK